MSNLMPLPPRKWPLVHAAQPERMPAVDAGHHRTKKVPRSLEDAFGPSVRSSTAPLHIQIPNRQRITDRAVTVASALAGLFVIALLIAERIAS